MEIETKGYIYSFFGRKRRLLNAKSTDKALKAHDIRSGTNAVIQSVASDCNLTGAMNAYDRLKANKVDFNMFALVHDSVVSEVREDMVEDYIRILKEELQHSVFFPSIWVSSYIEYRILHINLPQRMYHQHQSLHR